MKRIAVLFGGKSCEHDISVITAVQAINGIDAAEYAVLPVYIDTEGNFFTGGNFDRIETFRKFVGKA
ncbi:MAG: D-alanine--D-alanine ligase, partial [Clostridiales bacterium]|nr:D-alanine--D-alanine ligase [Clostridiales bacterium]